MNKYIQKARLALLLGKTWRYLRYLHFRDALLRISDKIEAVCVCGAGHGLAEVAVAAEFPHITFTLTDIINRKHGYPNYQRAQDMAWKWGLDNMRFSVWSVLEPANRKFDLICSTEMLEHIQDAETAVRNMRAASLKYIYCLVPFADDATNADPEKRKRAREKHEHYVYGYDQKSLEKFFPDPIMLAGTYWQNAGLPFRQKLTEMDPETIKTSQAELEAEAESDLIEAVPHTLQDALGIKILARV